MDHSHPGNNWDHRSSDEFWRLLTRFFFSKTRCNVQDRGHTSVACQFDYFICVNLTWDRRRSPHLQKLNLRIFGHILNGFFRRFFTWHNEISVIQEFFEIYSAYKENPEFPRNMLLSKNSQFLLNLYETWSKWLSH